MRRYTPGVIWIAPTNGDEIVVGSIVYTAAPLAPRISGALPTPRPLPPPPPAPVAFYADDRIVVTEGPMNDRTAEFLRNPDGSIAWLRLGGRLFHRAE